MTMADMHAGLIPEDGYLRAQYHAAKNMIDGIKMEPDPERVVITCSHCGDTYGLHRTSVKWDNGMCYDCTVNAEKEA